MARFRCMNCNYSFTPKVPDRDPRMCPNCGDKESLRREESTEELLEK